MGDPTRSISSRWHSSPGHRDTQAPPPRQGRTHGEEDEVVAALEIVKGVMPKLELVVQKLDNMERKLDNLEGYVKVVDGKINPLQEKVERFEKFNTDTTSSIKVLDEGMTFANSEIESLKEKAKALDKSLKENKKESTKLKNKKLYMEVYQRRENLWFYGIKEASDTTEENIRGAGEIYEE
ncbi:hypothetical protein OS493_038069 [Desmophyllum pertusum]|uniref:Uncharacterized protein n=1 Tax=Desmophyllum pertusum TaxID=174260 RepID=A0A9X0CDI7_9CNID|nr:hypothetical protein OS493_038069 [Desmophyllum pertusum]